MKLQKAKAAGKIAARHEVKKELSTLTKQLSEATEKVKISINFKYVSIFKEYDSILLMYLYNKQLKHLIQNDYFDGIFVFYMGIFFLFFFVA